MSVGAILGAVGKALVGSVETTAETVGSTIAPVATTVESAASGAASAASTITAGIEQAAISNVPLANNILKIIPQIPETAVATEMPGIVELTKMAAPVVKPTNLLDAIPKEMVAESSPIPSEAMQAAAKPSTLETAANKMQVSQEPIQKTPGEELTTNEQNPVKGGEKSALELKSEGSQPDEGKEEKEEGEEEKPKEEAPLTEEQKEAQAKQEEEANQLLIQINTQYVKYQELQQRLSHTVKQQGENSQLESEVALMAQILMTGQIIDGFKKQLLSLVQTFPLIKQVPYLSQIAMLDFGGVVTANAG